MARPSPDRGPPGLDRRLLNRRGFLTLAGGGLAAGLGLPSGVRAGATDAARRRFLFIHCRGGWDTTYVFQPNFGAAGVDMEADSVEAEANGIRFVDAESRPLVRQFLETHGASTCVVNGIEVPSVTHERCSRIMLTGKTDGAGDDWGATLAGRSASPLLLPYLVVSGSAFTDQYTDRVVRVGSNGQLGALLDGNALLRSDRPVNLPSPGSTSRVDAWLSERAAGLSERSPMAAAFARAHADQVEFQEWGDTLRLGGAPSGCTTLLNDAATVLDAFEAGLARTALVEYLGWCSEGWDTHSNNSRQGLNFNELFDYLGRILADLATRTAASGAPLADEVTIVVLSEMGRSPLLLRGEGRDHWTFTSAMLVGAGVRGGQVIGGFDDGGYGLGADFASGDATLDGPVIQAANLGATLLALGDVDPGAVAPLTAAVA
ncbi:MAG: DUF1501 domain-containing protein [Pseudomonadota bacterium]|nr:DUF1501 domain-containing protein [Pseudomonadota bacterium]